ncbi:TetR family transcriptional regulator [Streptomyces sp. NPDC017529]|uniref:SbtR family transcriptional regulator n=1 Tax=Streptomyces sp. NPDC017529 TaxID=3365000 RepID=UPI0037BA0657
MGRTDPKQAADAQRNQQTLLAAAVFVTSGVVAVYRHQVEACAEAGPRLLADAGSPFTALCQWADLFVVFLVTKHGLANALQSDSSGFDALHAYFLDRLVPVCGQLPDAAVEAGDNRPGTQAFELMRGIGNLCIGHDGDSRYDPRRLVELLLQGLREPHPS